MLHLVYISCISFGCIHMSDTVSCAIVFMPLKKNMQKYKCVVVTIQEKLCAVECHRKGKSVSKTAADLSVGIGRVCD